MLPENAIDTDTAVVFCASFDLGTKRHSLVAARSANVSAYCMPYDRYLKWERGSKFLPISTQASILVHAFETGNWSEAMRRYVSVTHLSAKKRTMDDEWRRRKDETRNILDAMMQIPK